MPKKIIKDIFLKEKEGNVPLNEELKTENRRNGRFFLRLVMVLVGIVVLGGFGLIVLGKVVSGTVNIVPHNEYLEINSDLKARANPSGEDLTFEIMQMEVNESQALTATGVSSSGKKSSGKIIIYNSYSSAPQKLIATTRFETKDGKIYRIPQAITIPGMGSVEVDVYADKPGEEYNIGLTDFTVPGLKGGLKYEKIYARSKTEMKGGSSGNVKLVRQEDILSAKEEAAKKIKKKLMDSFIKQKPDGFALYEGGIKIEYIDDPSNPKAGDVASGLPALKIRGIVIGYLIKKDSLSKALLRASVNGLSHTPEANDKIDIINLESLKMEIIGASQQNKEIAINISGKAHFVWDIDTKNLTNDLVGHKGKDYNSVFQSYSGIKKASVSIRPPWWSRLPSDSSKIKINIIL